ncbi:MAG: PAS domain-containing protein, partial [Chloroflexota bacterium]
TCTFLLGVLKPRLKTLKARTDDIVQGSLLGVFTVLVMLNPIQVADGIVFDLPDVIIAVVGALGGLIPAAIVTLIVIIYRLSVSGVGTPADVASALTSVMFGLGLYFYGKRHTSKVNFWLIGLGLAVAVQTLVWHLLLPDETEQAIVTAISLPLLVTFPLSSWLFGVLLLYQQRHIELETTLSTERTMLRTLIDHVPDYIFIKDSEGRFLLSNLAQAQAAHVAVPSDLVGRTAAAFFPAEYLTQPDLDDQAVLQGASIIAQERRSVNVLGQPIWISTTKVPLRDADGQVSGIVGISRDITAHKQVEAALEQERHLQAAQAQVNEEMRQVLQSTLDAFPAITVVLENDGTIMLVNKPWKRFADENGGLSPVHYLGFNYLSVCDTSVEPMAEEAAAAAAGIRTVIEGLRDDFYLEYPCPSASEKRWFGLRVSPFSEAVPRRVVVAHIDMTERKQAEEALKHERNMLRTLIDNVPDYIFVKDGASRYLLSNLAHAHAAGATVPADLIGK